MVKLQHFNDTYQYYKQLKITFRLLQEQAIVMLAICENLHASVSNPLDITQADIEWLLQQSEATQNYSEFLGGSVYVCETEHDLLEIHGCDFKWADEHDGNWPNVTDLPLSWDVCTYLEEASGDPDWVVILLCWNNAGGSVYYVPKHLWAKARVTEHIEASR